MAFDRNMNGYAITSQDYFCDLGEALGKTFRSASRSSVCEARKKIDWRAFEFLLKELRSVSAAGEEFKWRGHRVCALDGTKLTLPNSKEILSKFPQRKIGGRGNAESKEVSHYPFGVLVTACDVFSGQPLAARLENMHGSERKLAMAMIASDLQENDITLLDRGLDGVQVWSAVEQHGQYYVSRLREGGAQNNVGFVKEFIRSQRSEQIIDRRLRHPVTREVFNMRMRLIRGRTLKDNSVLVLGTNLLDADKYPAGEVLELYAKRWKVETLYARSKTLLDVEKFHARSTNGVFQEVFANLVVLAMTAVLARQAMETGDKKIDRARGLPNFKNTAQVVKRNLIYYLGQVQLRGRRLREKVERILYQVRQVRCQTQAGRSYPRYSRQAANKWAFAKANKIALFNQGRRAGESAGMRAKYE